MRHISVVVATLLASVAATGCKNNSTSPTTTTTTVATTTVATTSTTSTTTSIQSVFSVTGRVTSDKTGSTLAFPVIEIIQGANIGKRFTGNQDGTYSMAGLTGGTFVARFWADGYMVKDVTINLTTSNVTQDVQLTPAPPTTTTVTATAVQASFNWSPDPCTISAGGTTCTVTSTSTGDIASTQWLYGGKTINNQNSVGLVLGCGDLVGTGSVRTVSVRLNVTGTDGTLSTTDSGVPVQIVGAICP